MYNLNASAFYIALVLLHEYFTQKAELLPYTAYTPPPHCTTLAPVKIVGGLYAGSDFTSQIHPLFRGLALDVDIGHYVNNDLPLLFLSSRNFMVKID